MGMIATEGGYKLFVYSRKEHPPPHVHVFFNQKMVRINLYSLEEMGEYSFRIPKKIFKIVRKYRREAFIEWDRLNSGNEEV